MKTVFYKEITGTVSVDGFLNWYWNDTGKGVYKQIELKTPQCELDGSIHIFYPNGNYHAIWDDFGGERVYGIWFTFIDDYKDGKCEEVRVVLV